MTSHAEHSSKPSAFDESDIKKDSTRGHKKPNKKVLTICVILTIIVIVGIGVYYYFQYQHQQMLLKNPVAASEVIQENVIAAVQKLTPLPTNENPAIAKVTDITKLKNQPFFRNAKNGDFVLLYSQNKRVILYDPNANKVIESVTYQSSPAQANAQVGAQSNTEPQAVSAALNKPIPVAIYNGTTIAGLAKKTQAFLQTKMTNIEFISETNAAKQNYPQTLVIDLTGKNPVPQEELANLLGGKVSSMPSGEATPANADFLVILGSNSSQQ